MLSERDRFLIFFDRIVRFTDVCYERCLEAPAMKAMKPLSEVRYGARIPSVSATSLYVHMTVVEHHWTDAICVARDGQVVPVTQDPELTMRLSEGDVIAKVSTQNKMTFEHLAALNTEQLSRTLCFVGRQYTVMGFLWGFLAHRSYHVGNLDLLMRLSGAQPPDFFDFSPYQLA